MAKRTVDSIVQTFPRSDDLEIIAAVDADEETRQLLGPRVAVVSYSRAYRGCSVAWNDALSISTGDQIVFAADDLVFRDGWFQAAMERMDQFPDGWGLVGFNDGHWGEDLSTHYVMDRRFVINVLGGVVAWPFYRHSFNDVEVNARARRAGRYAWAEGARVDHVHWLFGDREQDDTDRRTLNNHGESERIFKRREAMGFPSDYPPVIVE